MIRLSNGNVVNVGMKKICGIQVQTMKQCLITIRIRVFEEVAIFSCENDGLHIGSCQQPFELGNTEFVMFLTGNACEVHVFLNSINNNEALESVCSPSSKCKILRPVGSSPKLHLE